MNEESSDAKKVTVFATSEGSPNRDSAFESLGNIYIFDSSGRHSSRIEEVGMARTRADTIYSYVFVSQICGKGFTKDCTATFTAEYTEKPFIPTSVTTDVFRIIEPPSPINATICFTIVNLQLKVYHLS